MVYVQNKPLIILLSVIRIALKATNLLTMSILLHA